MSYAMAVIHGIKRKIVKLAGSVLPMSSVNTTVAKWLSTAPYDPLNGEVLVGIDGPDRIQLAADGKLYPPLCASGYPPSKTAVRKASSALNITEIPAGGVNLGVNGSWWEGVIVVPPTATLTKGGVTMAAPGVAIVVPISLKDQQAFSSGVASSWAVYWPVTEQNVTVTSR